MGQNRITQMSPERRLCMRDPLCERIVGARDGLPEVEAGKIRAPAALASVGDVTKDARRG
jgi:hypothetical protein